MTAELKLNLLAALTGLGKEQNFNAMFTTTTTPDAATYNYRTQATSDSEEALDLGDISTVELIIIKAATNDLDIDADFDSSFNADICVQEGEVAVFKPSGTVYVKNNGAGETAVYEYLCVGTT